MYGTFCERVWVKFLQANKTVIAYLFLAQERQVKQDFKRLSVRSQDDELRNTTIQGLGGWCPGQN